MHNTASDGSSKLYHRGEAAQCCHFAVDVTFAFLDSTDLQIDEMKRGKL